MYVWHDEYFLIKNLILQKVIAPEVPIFLHENSSVNLNRLLFDDK